MTSIIKLEIVSNKWAPCYVLQVDEFRLMLDCGWDGNLDTLGCMRKHVGHVDALLLSHGDPQYIGSLPYLVGKAGLSCPIFSTPPVMKMGELAMYDLYSSRSSGEPFDAFTLEDVDLAFSQIKVLKHNQTYTFEGKGSGICVTPVSSGHSIGGSMWKIRKDDEEEIIYCMGFNHKRERHLNAWSMDNLVKPAILIMDVFNAGYTADRRADRDQQLLDCIKRTLKRGGKVLIVSDTGTRSLELMLMLDAFWKAGGQLLQKCPVAFINYVARHVVDAAKQQMEWMSDKVMKSFEDTRTNPYQFKFIEPIMHLKDFMDKEYRVAMVSQPELDYGPGRDILIQWMSDPESQVIVTKRTVHGTLANILLDMIPGSQHHLTIQRKVRLEGEELKQHLDREEEEEKKKQQQISEGDNEDSDEEEEEDDEGDHIPDKENGLMTGAAAAIGSQGRKKVTHDLMHRESRTKNSFFKQTNRSFPMYPCKDRKILWDDYGEIINPDDYVLSEYNPNVSQANTFHQGQGEGDLEVKGKETEVEKDHPTKWVTEPVVITKTAKVDFIDFEGRSDGDAYTKIVSMIKPRKLVLVRGDRPQLQPLVNSCLSLVNDNSMDRQPFCPDMGDTVDATTETHIYPVTLKDSLVSALSFSRSKDGAELAWVEGQIEMSQLSLLHQQKKADGEGHETIEGDGDSNDNESVQEGAIAVKKEPIEGDLMPTLAPLPPAEIPGHITIFVNELKLSDFKGVLNRNGIITEFSGGVLYCSNQLVAVKRNEAGRINLEGTICDDYYKIRDLLYQQYAII